MTQHDWHVVWRAEDERLFVEARTEKDWIRHRVRSNGPADGSVVVLQRGDRVLFVGADRPAVNRTLLELPRGQADVEDDGPIDTAKRELFEETGRQIADAELLGTVFPDSGLNGDAVNVVVGVEDDARPPAVGEYAYQVWLTQEDIRHHIAVGEIRDAISMSALALRDATSNSGDRSPSKDAPSS